MHMTKGCILLASHGTPGARAAERHALAEAAASGRPILHLLVVPGFWAGMRGDDWLNSPGARNAFGNYVEDLLSREVEQEVNRLGRAARAAGVALHSRLRQGDPARELLAVAAECAPALVVIGSPRRKGESGYRCRLKIEPLLRHLPAPLLIVPREDAAQMATRRQGAVA